MRNPCILMATAIVLFGAGSALAQPTPASIETLGIYVWRDTPAYHAFWKVCGFDLLQFCDTQWAYGVETHDEAYQTFAAEIAQGKKDGFRTDVILFGNIVQWPGPGRSPNPVGERFTPGQDAAALRERLGYIRRSVRELRQADSFTFFAGDPGGGPDTSLAGFVAMASEVREIVRTEAPGADFNVNLWAVTQWDRFDVSAHTPEFWRLETELARRFLSESGMLARQIGVQFPTHDYYRPLAFRVYEEAGVLPQPYPSEQELSALAQDGVPRLWAWPYFLLDEADDGYINAEFPDRAPVQAQTRYIHAYLSRIRDLGFNGVVANFSYGGFEGRAMNYYAFGRFVRDPAVTPAQAIGEYAAFVAAPGSAETLARILMFLENHGVWQQSLPEAYRLPDFPVLGIASADDALQLIGSVEARSENPLPLPRAPADTLRAIRESLASLVTHDVGVDDPMAR